MSIIQDGLLAINNDKASTLSIKVTNKQNSPASFALTKGCRADNLAVLEPNESSAEVELEVLPDENGFVPNIRNVREEIIFTPLILKKVVCTCEDNNLKTLRDFANSQRKLSPTITRFQAFKEEKTEDLSTGIANIEEKDLLNDAVSNAKMDVVFDNINALLDATCQVDITVAGNTAQIITFSFCGNNL